MPSARARRDAIVFGLLLVACFALRVYYGLSLELQTPDDVQIYLLGLKFFATGQWPFFGPDVAVTTGLDVSHTTHQIAGPLQGLLVGLPLLLVREPEAPLIVLNVLSFAGLVLFARYLTRRFPLIPAWITYAWLLTCPWTLNFSTHVYNPSYLLVLSCLFFVGFFELVPSFAANMLSPGTSFFLMGLSLAASFQVHLSWPLLLPFVATAILVRARDRILTPSQLAWLLAGAALPSVLLVPTVAAYGVTPLFEAAGSNIAFNGGNIGAIFYTTARFLSFASFELSRFLGQTLEARLDFLRHNPWLAPLVLGLGLVGFVQPVLMLIVLLRPRLLRLEGDPCRSIRSLVVATLILLGMVFLVTTRAPIARDYYILCPVALLTGYLSFGGLMQTPRARRWAVGILASGAILHAGLAAQHLTVDSWASRRSTVMQAMQEGEYRVLGYRRAHVRF